MVNIMIFTISIFIVFGLAFYFYKTEGKRVVKRYFKYKLIYLDNRQNLFVILKLYFDKNKIRFLDIDLNSCYLQGRNNNEIFVRYKCTENSKIVTKTIIIQLKDL